MKPTRTCHTFRKAERAAPRRDPLESDGECKDPFPPKSLSTEATSGNGMKGAERSRVRRSKDFPPRQSSVSRLLTSPSSS
eukprot:2872293-Pleurochrysis_carterae.AAC.1